MGKLTCQPIFSKIVSLFTEHNDLQYAAPGGLIGVGTKIDPTLCRADRMVGQVLGTVGALPDIYTEIEISYFLLRRLLGVKTEGDKKGAKVQKLAKNEMLMVNIVSLFAEQNDLMFAVPGGLIGVGTKVILPFVVLIEWSDRFWVVSEPFQIS